MGQTIGNNLETVFKKKNFQLYQTFRRMSRQFHDGGGCYFTHPKKYKFFDISI